MIEVIDLAAEDDEQCSVQLVDSPRDSSQSSSSGLVSMLVPVKPKKYLTKGKGRHPSLPFGQSNVGKHSGNKIPYFGPFVSEPVTFHDDDVCGLQICPPVRTMMEFTAEATMFTAHGYTLQIAPHVTPIFVKRELIHLPEEKSHQDILDDNWLHELRVNVPSIKVTGRLFRSESTESAEKAKCACHQDLLIFLFNNDVVKEAEVELSPLREELLRAELQETRRLQQVFTMSAENLMESYHGGVERREEARKSVPVIAIDD